VEPRGQKLLPQDPSPSPRGRGSSPVQSSPGDFWPKGGRRGAAARGLTDFAIEGKERGRCVWEEGRRSRRVGPPPTANTAHSTQHTTTGRGPRWTGMAVSLVLVLAELETHQYSDLGAVMTRFASFAISPPNLGISLGFRAAPYSQKGQMTLSVETPCRVCAYCTPTRKQNFTLPPFLKEQTQNSPRRPA